MTDNEKGNFWKDFRRMLPGLLISVVAIAALLYFVDLSKVKQAWQDADLRLVPVAAVILVLSMLARAVAWRTILQEKVSVTKSFFTISEGYLLNTVLPFRLGELGRAMLLSTTAGLSFWEILATIVVERIFDVALMAGLLLATIPFVIGAEWALQGAILAATLVVVGFVVLYLVTRNQEWAMRIFEKLFGRWPKIVEFGRDKLESIFAGFTALTDIGRFLRVFLWMLVSWTFNVTWYFVLLLAFLPNARFLWSAFTVGMTGLGVSIPSSPGFIGVLEWSIVFGLTRFAVDESAATAYAILSHAIYIAVTVAFGIFGLARDGQSLGQLYFNLRNRKEQPPQ
jgi:uncharacterized protein (TIRG00374 family)